MNRILSFHLITAAASIHYPQFIYLYVDRRYVLFIIQCAAIACSLQHINRIHFFISRSLSTLILYQFHTLESKLINQPAKPPFSYISQLKKTLEINRGKFGFLRMTLFEFSANVTGCDRRRTDVLLHCYCRILVSL